MIDEITPTHSFLTLNDKTLLDHWTPAVWTTDTVPLIQKNAEDVFDVKIEITKINDELNKIKEHIEKLEQRSKPCYCKSLL